MKHYWSVILFVIFLLTACTGSAAPNATAPTFTQIPPTDTLVPTSTVAPTPTTAPTETSASTDTPVATLTYGFTIMSVHDGMIDGVIPLDITDTPTTEACGAPIFNTAIAGSGNPSKEYFYTTDSHPMDVYQYYMTEMPKLNFELIRISDDFFGNIPLASADLNQFHSSIWFSNPSGRSVTIAILKDFENGLIYVWMLCSG